MVQAVESSEEMPAGLREAIMVARARQRRDRTREPLRHWLWQRTYELNQRSVVEIVDLLVETHIGSCVKHATLVNEVFSALVRLDLVRELTH